MINLLNQTTIFNRILNFRFPAFPHIHNYSFETGQQKIRRLHAKAADFYKDFP